MLLFEQFHSVACNTQLRVAALKLCDSTHWAKWAKYATYQHTVSSMLANKTPEEQNIENRKARLAIAIFAADQITVPYALAMRL